VAGSAVVSGARGASGTATPLASLLTFGFGVMAACDRALLAAALAVGTTAILSMRGPLHRLAGKLEERDLYAALQLAAITVIVLPILPDRTYGPSPLDALNPFRIGIFVVLVAAVGFLGYAGVKTLGAGRGILVEGVLGGLVSSTAATYSLAARSREAPELAREVALGIALAWGMTCVRMLAIVAVLDARLLPLAAPALLAAALAGTAGAALGFARGRAAMPPAGAYTNPFSVLGAVRFGAVFSAVLVVAKLA